MLIFQLAGKAILKLVDIAAPALPPLVIQPGLTARHMRRMSRKSTNGR